MQLERNITDQPRYGTSLSQGLEHWKEYLPSTGSHTPTWVGLRLFYANRYDTPLDLILIKH